MARDVVSNVRDRLEIVDVIQPVVPSLKRTGSTWKGLCPFHQEKTPSFIVFPKTQSFHCFGCGKSGDVFTFYMETEHVDFREALTELARRAGVELESQAPRRPEEEEKRHRLVEINELAATWFHHILLNATHGEPGREVIRDRHVSADSVETWNLGFAPDSWDMLLNFLASRNVTADEALAAGLASANDRGGVYDRFRGRLMFPIRDRDGQTVGFGGRALGDAQPKYLNTAQTDIFDKSSLVYGLDLAADAIREQSEVVLVEGYMDAIAAHEFGFRNVVATMGTALTDDQVSLIRRGNPRIVLALDADAAGQMATLRGLETMTNALDADAAPVFSADRIIGFERKLKTDIAIVQMTSGKDPDEFIRSDPQAWPKLIASARPFMDFVVDILTRSIDPTDARAKSEAIQRAIPLLRQIPDPVRENHYTRQLARKLDISEDTIVREKRRFNTGGRSPRRAEASPSGPARSRPLSTEDRLLAMLVQHHQYTFSLLEDVDANALLDGRNRQLLAILQDPVTFELQGEQLVLGLDEVMADHAERLISALPTGGPQAFPTTVVQETRQLIARLGRDRYRVQLDQLHHDLREAQEQGDQDEVQEVWGRINAMAAERQRFEPKPSPYFVDTRSRKNR